VWGSYLAGQLLPTTTTVEVSRLATHARCKPDQRHRGGRRAEIPGVAALAGPAARRSP
jgi:hypothetical protein